MFIDVLVEVPVQKKDMTFTYEVPDEMIIDIEIGKRVLVPFGSNKIEGYIVKINSSNKLDLNIKKIIKVIDKNPVLNKELLELGKLMSGKYLCSLISCYQVMLPKALKASYKSKLKPKYEKSIILVSNDFNDIRGSAQKAIIADLQHRKVILKKEITSKSALKALIEKKIVKEIKKEIYSINITDDITYDNVLNKDQQEAVKEITSNLNKPETILLHGVTGSGKTEVYMEIIEKVLSLEKTAIVLVPEISLTPQTTKRFIDRFGNKIALLHSGLSDQERYDEIRKIIRKEVSIVIGARSAIFAPLSNIGVIVIDEEHVSSYKQDNNPRYNALDMAGIRAKTHNCPVILGSATPSIESYARAKKGYYKLVNLKSRIYDRKLPKVEIIDMRESIKKGYNIFSKELIDSINIKMKNQEKIMLLMNKRGYSNYLMCNTCGYIYKCQNCEISLTYHKTSNMMRCHYCGYATNRKPNCPQCTCTNLKDFGTGTQKVEEQINELFPNAKVCRMDRDTTSKKGAHKRIIDDFAEDKYDILLGTQMISKGLDFPNVTLVGVINGDTSLNFPNFRSAEQTFQLLSQILGRSGRGKLSGEAIIQTFNPENYSILAAAKHDYISFYKKEMGIRKSLYYPPYCFIVLIKIMSKDFEVASKESRKIINYLNKNLNKNVVILGPSISNVLKQNNLYNFQCIIKYKKEENLLVVLKNLLKIYEINRNIRIEYDFNPINL